MPASTNRIELDFTNNPDLSNIFAGKKSGDTCELTVKLKVREIDEKRCIGSIEKVTSDYHDEEKEATPTPESPIMIEMSPEPKYA